MVYNVNVSYELLNRTKRYLLLIFNNKMFTKLLKPFAMNHYRYVQRARLYSNQIQDLTSNDAVVLSETCVKRLKELCNNNGFLRLCVESGGCSGFQYKFSLDDKLSNDDKIFERDGVKVVIDETSLDYIKGSTIDYHTELIRSAFRVVQNPNADVGCSCGASFSIKID